MKKYIFYLLLVIFILLWPPLIVFIIPGIFFLFHKEENIFKKAVYIISSSFAFWIISIYFIKLVNISLIKFSLVISLISITLFIIISSFRTYNLKFEKKDYIIILIFLLILFIRLIPFFTLTIPGVGDMSMHTAITKLIAENDGIPDTFRPVFPLDYFYYTTGFHTISSLVYQLGNFEIYRATFFIFCILLFLIHLALFSFINLFFDKKISIITSTIIMFLCSYPQLIIRFGSATTLMSFFLLIAGIHIFENFTDKLSRTDLFYYTLVFSAALISHIIPFIIFIYLFGFVGLFYLIKTKKIKVIFKNVFIICFLSMILLTPFLYYFFNHLSYGGSEEKINLYNQISRHSVSFGEYRGILSYILFVPIQFASYTNLLLIILSTSGFVLLFFKRREIAVRYFIFACAISFIILHSLFPFLPLLDITLNDRTSLFFLIPLSLFLASFIGALKKINKKLFFILISLYLIISFSYFTFKEIDYETSPYGIDRTNISFKQAANLVFYQAIGGPVALYLFGMDSITVLTKEDLEAFEWIKKNTDINSLFINNNREGGVWLTSITYRPLFYPHTSGLFRSEVREARNLSEFVIDDELERGIFNAEKFKLDIQNFKDRGIEYVYIGKKKFGKTYFNNSDFETSPNFIKVYEKDGVNIYQIK